MSQRHDGREPCPYRILDDVGGAFAMGCAGGAVWYAVKGARNSPVGERLRGGMMAVKARAPILGGNFAVWGGLFSCFDCTLVAIRHKVRSQAVPRRRPSRRNNKATRFAMMPTRSALPAGPMAGPMLVPRPRHMHIVLPLLASQLP